MVINISKQHNIIAGGGSSSGAAGVGAGSAAGGTSATSGLPGATNFYAAPGGTGGSTTIAAKSIPDFQQFEHLWDLRSPLRWDVTDPVPAAKGAIALLSDWLPATSGEILHVDGGFHAMGG